MTNGEDFVPEAEVDAREPGDSAPPQPAHAVPLEPAAVTGEAPVRAVDPPAQTPPPFAAELALLKEAAVFAGALAQSARAELHLSMGAMVRAATLGLAAALAVAVAWLCGTIALLFALHAVLGSAAAAFTVVALVHALIAGIALWRRAIWSERIGFARTRSALAAALADSEKHPP